jgi:hypothetical protein
MVAPSVPRRFGRGPIVRPTPCLLHKDSAASTPGARRRARAFGAKNAPLERFCGAGRRRPSPRRFGRGPIVRPTPCLLHKDSAASTPGARRRARAFGAKNAPLERFCGAGRRRPSPRRFGRGPIVRPTPCLLHKDSAASTPGARRRARAFGAKNAPLERFCGPGRRRPSPRRFGRGPIVRPTPCLLHKDSAGSTPGARRRARAFGAKNAPLERFCGAGRRRPSPPWRGFSFGQNACQAYPVHPSPSQNHPAGISRPTA